MRTASADDDDDDNELCLESMKCKKAADIVIK